MISSGTSRYIGAVAALAVFAVLLPALLPPAGAAPQFLKAEIPHTVSTGQVVSINVSMTSGLPVTQVLIGYRASGDSMPTYGYMNLASGNSTNGTWTYEIPAREQACTLDIWITARDALGVSGQYPASGSVHVDVEGKSPAKPFPWNLVLMVIVLGVVLVLTELAFKPGFYRPTGRERAEALEEEDRRREAHPDTEDTMRSP